jgi:hypothetical protein
MLLEVVALVRLLVVLLVEWVEGLVESPAGVLVLWVELVVDGQNH